MMLVDGITSFIFSIYLQIIDDDGFVQELFLGLFMSLTLELALKNNC